MKKLIIFLLLYFAFNMTIIAQIEISEVKSQVSRFSSARQYDKAIDYLGKLIEIDPTEAFLYQARAEIFFLTQRTNYSIVDITKAIQIEPANSDLYFLRAKYHQANKDTDSFIKDMESAISSRPEDSFLRFKAATKIFEAGDFKRSLKNLEVLKPSEEPFPFSTNIYKLRYKNDLALELFEDALDDAFKAIDTIPVNSNDWKVRQSAAIHLGNLYDYKDILPILSTKLEQNGTRFDNYLRFINLFEQKAKGVIANPRPGKDEAETLKNQVFARTSSYNILYFSNRFMISGAQKLVQAGEIERAEKMFERLVQNEPVWYHRSIRATYYKENSKYDRAIDDLTIAIEHSEGSPIWETQRMLMTPASTPGSQTWKMALLTRRGDLYFVTKRYQNAIDDFRLAIETDPQWKEKLLEKIAAAEDKLHQSGVSPK